MEKGRMPVLARVVKVPPARGAGVAVPPGARGSADTGKDIISKPMKAAKQLREFGFLLIEIPH
jgi:hypothetical protein